AATLGLFVCVHWICEEETPRPAQSFDLKNVFKIAAVILTFILMITDLVVIHFCMDKSMYLLSPLVAVLAVQYLILMYILESFRGLISQNAYIGVGVSLYAAVLLF
ncbi:hypothetical protein PFISCL1PPCAC_8476, partial [Pristionchus fissidentatus]